MWVFTTLPLRPPSRWTILPRCLNRASLVGGLPFVPGVAHQLSRPCQRLPGTSAAFPRLEPRTGTKGLLLSTFFWSYAAMQIPIGWCADRLNLRWFYAGALTFWSLAQVFTGLVTGPGTLVACVFHADVYYQKDALRSPLTEGRALIGANTRRTGIDWLDEQPQISVWAEAGPYGSILCRRLTRPQRINKVSFAVNYLTLCRTLIPNSEFGSRICVLVFFFKSLHTLGVRPLSNPRIYTCACITPPRHPPSRLTILLPPSLTRSAGGSSSCCSWRRSSTISTVPPSPWHFHCFPAS
jgi:hypothetical protein